MQHIVAFSLKKDEILEQKDVQIAELLARIAELESAKAG